jgi:hypothetical protein
MKTAPRKLPPRAKTPSGARTPPAPAKPARRPKVWSGTKKRLGVSPLQLTLPGMGIPL